MLYQLASGRTIEISIEQFLDMTDQELQELECISESYSIEMNDPFYKPYAKGRTPIDKPLSADKKYGVDSKSNKEKLDDEYFHKDDI